MRLLLFLIPALLLAQAPGSIRKVSDRKTTPSATASKPLVAKNFKESGSPSAPITVEVYTDYECPACRELYLNALPSLTSDFVATGKVRLLHRDYPLSQHKYSRLATKYANAAGQIGKYELVANQLFVSQPEWAQSGNVDGTVAKVLSAPDMEKVRNLVKNDARLDDTVAKDITMGNEDHLTQTPTLVIVANGKREVVGGITSYPILKSYLNKKLER